MKKLLKKIKSSLLRDEINEIQELSTLLNQVSQFSQADKCQLSSTQVIASRHYLDVIADVEHIKNELIQKNISVKNYSVDINDFKNWMNEFGELTNAYKSCGAWWIEKCLEHYISCRLTNISVQDILIDIAACESNFVEVLESKGTKAYKLDLTYPKKIDGNRIGADASDTKLPDNFADILTLHCAFECFMGKADTGFVKEAGRILKKGGRLIISPLYLNKSYFNVTGHLCNQSNIKIDEKATRLWRDTNYYEPFDRQYSVNAFLERVYSELPENLKGEIVFIDNIVELSEAFKDQKIYCHFIFYCNKI